MTDINGTIIREIELQSRQNQLILNLNGLSNGIYLFSLFVNGELIDSNKLSKSRH